MIEVDHTALEKMVREGSDLSGLNLSGKSYPGADLAGADFSGLNLKSINLEGAVLTGADFSGAFLEEANLKKAALEKTDFKKAVLDQADFEAANLTGANFESGILDTCKFRKSNLSSANFFGASIVGTNLQGALLDNAFLKSAALNGAYLLEASLKKANLENADLSCAYMEKTVLEGANLQGATLVNAYLRHSFLLKSNLTGANLSGADLRSSRFVGCDLSEAVVEGAKAYQADFTGLIARNTHFKFLDLSPEADGKQIFPYSEDWLEKHQELFESCFKSEEDSSTRADEPPPPLPAEPGKPSEPSAEPFVMPEDLEEKAPEQKPARAQTLPELPSQVASPPSSPIPEPSEPVKRPSAIYEKVQILLYLKAPVGESLLAALSFYLLNIRESFSNLDLKIDKVENKGNSSHIVFALQPTGEADTYISLFMILHFLKFSYDEDLKNLYERLKEAELVEEQSHHTDWPRIDLWSLQLAKYPEVSHKFTDSKSNLIKAEIALSEDLSLKIEFDNGKPEAICFSHGCRRDIMVIDIENQLSRARGYCDNQALRDLLYSLKRAVMEAERISAPDREYACFSLFRFIEEISNHPFSEKELPIPAGCYWSRFWNEIKYIPEISSPAAEMKKYFPRISALMV